MRLNRSTIIFVVALVVFIVAVLLLNQSRTTETTSTTSTPTAAPVALVPGVTEETLTRLEVRDNTTGQRIVLTKSGVDSPWVYENTSLAGADSDTASGTEEPADPGQMSTLVAMLTNLNSSDSFEDSNLSSFGLQNPQYSVLATTSDGSVYIVHIGGQSRVNPRYYVIVEQPGLADVTSTSEPSAIGTESVESVGNPAPAGDNIQGAELADFTPEVTDPALVTNLTQAVIVSQNIEATQAAIGTQRAQTTAEVAVTEAAGDAQAVATDIAEATLEATAEVPVVEPTLAPLAEPLVSLSGTFRVYVVQKSTMDRFISLITTPPVLMATATPAVTIPAIQGTDEPTVEPPVTSLTDATQEATAEATAAP